MYDESSGLRTCCRDTEASSEAEAKTGSECGGDEGGRGECCAADGTRAAGGLRNCSNIGTPACIAGAESGAETTSPASPIGELASEVLSKVGVRVLWRSGAEA